MAKAQHLTASATEVLVRENEEVHFRESTLARVSYYLLKLILGPIVRWLWIHSVEGLEHIPKKGPIIVVANHSSYLDFICFIAVSPRRIHYLAAEKFYKSVVWKPLMVATSQIYIDRKAKDKTHVHKKVESALRQGRMVGIFPEGTRSADGEIQRPYTGVARYAMKHKVPVLPVGICNTYEVLSRYDKFPKLKKIVKICISPPMYFTEYYNRHHDESFFEHLTHTIMEEISRLSGLVYRHRKNKWKEEN